MLPRVPATQTALRHAATPDIQLLLTGDELMSGDTVDSNSALIARELGPGPGAGPQVTLGDDRRRLVGELALLVRGEPMR
jgi:nicotinamide-nucleotide amidase